MIELLEELHQIQQPEPSDALSRNRGLIRAPAGTIKKRARNGRTAEMAAPHLDTVLRHIRKLAAGRGSPKRTDRQLLEISLPAVTRQPLPLSLPVTDRWSTFLILARNIGSIRKRAARAEWLH